MDSQNSLQLAKIHNSSQEVREHAFKMEAVNKKLTPPVDKEKKQREACEGFESIFIQKMWEQMRATIPESNLLKGREEKFWQSMYDQELAKTMAGAGGIGLADMMYEQLSRNLSSASKSTANALGGQPSGFAEDLKPAPLLQAAAPPQAETAANTAEASSQQPKPPALAGLYAEVKQPDAQPAVPAQAAAEDGANPAIMAVLNELRAAHQASSSPPDGRQASGPKGLNLGAQPPLPPMQGEGQQAPVHQGKTYVSTLTRPVHKPTIGKRTVLPRAASGPRVPASQPVHRNLPFAEQETLQAQARGQLQNAPAIQPASAGSVPGPAAGQNSVGVEALNAFAAQQKAAQLAPGAAAPGTAAANTSKIGG
jgi:Rod binding domain-containing protein